MRIYKIRAADGTYSKGGSFPRFSKKGKVWKRKADLSNHFTQLDANGRANYRRANAVVEELEVIETPVAITPIELHIAAAEHREHERKQESIRRAAEYHRKQELALLLKLKSKYEPS